MINSVFQLVAPRSFAVKFEEISMREQVIVQPRKMAICHADQRYYLGNRPAEIMRKKLPMALIHECMGVVLHDPSGSFSAGEEVVLIPNVPGKQRGAIYENYAEGSCFLSSGHDGFMRELVNLPLDRVVSCAGVDPEVAAISEFVSVAVHAASRFDLLSHGERSRIAVFGDGSLGYVMSCVLTMLYPDSQIVVFGRNPDKLSMFTHVSEKYISSDIPPKLMFDHAFECAGGEGSGNAIDVAIDRIKPQGMLTLMGVSEYPVPVNTRNVLEKGMTVVGCSRSGRNDFISAVSLMRTEWFAQRLRSIIYVDKAVRDISDMKSAFSTDLQTPFKTVFEWDV